MVPLRAASIEKGSAGLVCEKDGGSMRRKGELEARRLEMALMRLWILGEPRLVLIGVALVVVGEDKAFRTEGSEGEVTSENLEGLEKSEEKSEHVFDFLVGELKTEGSMFSASVSSKRDEARRLPVDEARDGFRDEKVDVGVTAVDDAFSHASFTYIFVKAYHSACS